VLELRERLPEAIGRLGPDIMHDPPEVEAMVARLRAVDQSRQLGEALLDQRLVAGIGNMWRAEALFGAEISPWARVGEVRDEDLRHLLQRTSELMRASPRRRAVYRRAGLPCRRCGATVRSRPQGDQARTAYWCPGCQAGTGPAGS
jgi:endonuclease-8